MSKQRTEFDKWFDDYEHNNDIRLAIEYGAYEIAGDSWEAALANTEQQMKQEPVAYYYRCEFGDDFVDGYATRILLDGMYKAGMITHGHTIETPLYAATAEADKRMAALEGEVAELKTNLETAIWSMRDKNNSIRELQASNKHLREALLASDDLLRELPNSGGFYGLAIMENNQLVLSTTPAESLQAHDDELIEKVISRLEDMNAEGKYTLPDYIEAIRALKGQDSTQVASQCPPPTPGSKPSDS